MARKSKPDPAPALVGRIPPADTPPEQPPAPGDFMIVGIGASAGGLEAFGALLRELPEQTGMAYVLIQHLDPKRKSMLGELLARATRIPVEDVMDGTLVLPDHIYVMPPNANITLEGKCLRLGPRTLHRGQHMPIDIFMRSLALERRARSAGVILSGSLTDGALGVEAIKAEGGITFAQDDATAGQNDMPSAAIGTGCVDFVLPPAAIARELVRLETHPYARAELLAEEKVAASAGALAHPLKSARKGNRTPELQRVLLHLRSITGVDFSQYKMATVLRRIQRRMALLHLESLAEYSRRLRDNEGETISLYNDILIKVTSFFRDPEAFDLLKRKILPKLFKGRAPGDPLRIWSAGCATGEEAYSLAICVAEYLGRRRSEYPVQIFATDLSEASLERARESVYIENIALDVSADRLRRFFVPEGRQFRVAKSIREMIVFARQNLVKDPPFSRLDLITCRNLLIYLDASLQRRVFPLFHYALKPGGHLMLGNSETPGDFTDLFHPVDKKARVYVRRPGSSRGRYEPPAMVEAAAGAPGTGAPAAPALVRPLAEDRLPIDYQREADRILLNRFTPPGIVVDGDLEILQFRGQVQRYFEPVAGRASLNLSKLVKEGMFVPLRAAVALARRDAQPVRKRLMYEDRGAYREVEVEIVPLGGGSTPRTDRCTLILFKEIADEPPPAGEAAPAAEPATRSSRREVTRLEKELAASRQNLQNIVEEQDAAAEEIKSANEEILSANEELQSTNEELETAKEELQSSNEELHTVNEELQNRNVDLRNANNDLNNLFNSVAFAIVMLGNDGRIRRFTSLASRLFNLISSDVGRPFSNIKPNLRVDDLAGMIAEVVETITPRELEVQDRDGIWYKLTIRPYRTVENRIDGAVIALVDINDLKTSVEEVKVSRDFSEAVIATVREPLLVLDQRLRVHSANAAFYQVFHTTRADTLGKSLKSISGGQWNIVPLHKLIAAVMEKGTVFEDYALDHVFRGAGPKRLMLNARKVEGEGDRPPLVLLAIEDSTERQVAEQEVLAISEREQRRIAQELHDGLGQQLAGIGLMSKALLHHVDPVVQPSLLADLERVIMQVTEAVRLTRNMAQGMHPMQLETDQFQTAVHSIANNVESLFKVSCSFHCEIPCEPPGDGEGATQLFRIAQEAINNALKHGKPSRISISFHKARGANGPVLSIQDDGVGIRKARLGRGTGPAAAPRGMGLQIMRYRAESVGARLTVERAPAGGTLVQVIFENPAPLEGGG